MFQRPVGTEWTGVASTCGVSVRPVSNRELRVLEWAIEICRALWPPPAREPARVGRAARKTGDLRYQTLDRGFCRHDGCRRIDLEPVPPQRIEKEGYAMRVAAMDQRGDRGRARSDGIVRCGVKCSRVRVGDLLCKIGDVDLAGASERDARYLMGRAEDARRGCAMTLTFGRRGPRSPEEEDAYEERVADASVLKEPSVWRYRVTKRYGYMCFDFVEFMDFFRNGSSISVKFAKSANKDRTRSSAKDTSC